MCTGGVVNEKENSEVRGGGGGGAQFLVNIADFGPLVGLPPAAWYTVTASPSDSSPIFLFAAGPLCGLLCLGQANWPVSLYVFSL